MENFIVLICMCLIMSTAAGHFKFYEMEKTEKIKVREFDMEQEPRPVDLLSPNRKIRVTDTRGNLTNCGPQGFKFSVQWEPAVLNTQGTATFFWDLVAPCGFDSCNAHIDVFLPEIPDSPIFSLDQKRTCADFKKTVPNIKCPIKKNDEIQGQLVASDLTRFPTGNFTIAIKVTNDKGEMVVCGRANVELTP